VDRPKVKYLSIEKNTEYIITKGRRDEEPHGRNIGPTKRPYKYKAIENTIITKRPKRDWKEWSKNLSGLIQ
jgi:hypothetical protein